MDGDLAPLPALAALARKHDAWLMSDDAHGIGVVGGGRGSTFSHDARADVPLQMGTLSKAIGSYGAYVCASRPVIELIQNRARTLIYSTGLPAAAVAAALAALDVIERDPAYAARPLAKAKAFTRRLALPEAQSPIVPIVIGAAPAALQASRMLADEGFLVVAIRPPTVPEGSSRLRLTAMATHRAAELRHAAKQIASVAREIGLIGEPTAGARRDWGDADWIELERAA
jgi:8-amino-7-oxononanoate synthase